MSTDSSVDTAAQPQLKRVMGPGLLLLFVVGDILGTGVYALTGDVAAEVGGAAWVPFLVAFLIATVTAFSYLELVTKYPQAAGAAREVGVGLLHVHRHRIVDRRRHLGALQVGDQAIAVVGLDGVLGPDRDPALDDGGRAHHVEQR